MTVLGKFGCAFLIAIQMLWPAEAQAVNKCVVGGKVTYQDAPCTEERETVADGIARKQRDDVLHRKLDRLAAQGHGMVQRRPVAPRVGDEQARQHRAGTTLQEQTQRKNAESAAALTRILDDAKQACGGKLIDYPSVGMSDESFRNCTMHARFGGATQVVVSEDGKVPLRLYVFPTERASRVYSIGGVITAIRP